MYNQRLFNFEIDISNINIPVELNNPFSDHVPEISRIAAIEFQNFIASQTHNWNYDFRVRKGKMFGVLVIQKRNRSYSYIGTVSGQLQRNTVCDKFVPSIFDDSIDNFFINRGMTELTELRLKIESEIESSKINLLKEKRKQKSKALQQRLFDNYNFINLSGKEKNILEIFRSSDHRHPPSGAGDCAAPRLLQYAIKHDLKPVALSEFWWGNPLHNNERQHGVFYPACKDKCKPILEYILEDTGLYSNRSLRTDSCS